MAIKGNETQASSTTTTSNVDKRLTTESGNIFTLGESQVSVNQGGQIQIVEHDPAAAMAAVAATRDVGATFANVAENLARGSNEIAAQVADSQKEFVAVASGQTTVLKTVAVVGGFGLAILLLPKLFKKS